MKTLAFLQCQWFKDPERVRDMYRRNPGADFRRRFIARTLFAGCLTGARIEAVFADHCQRITFEETSKDIGDKASACFPPDLDHMRDVIDDVRPAIIIAFGAVARRALEAIRPSGVSIILAPHPAARGPETMADLRAARLALDKLLEGD